MFLWFSRFTRAGLEAPLPCLETFVFEDVEDDIVGIPLCFDAKHRGILMVWKMILLKFHCVLMLNASEF